VLCATLFGALVWASPAAASTISVDDVQVAEGTGGTVDATFTLTRSAGLFSGGATVSYQTVDGTATSPADYVAANGTATFPGALLGATQRQQVAVRVQGDALAEANETFRLLVTGSGEIADGDGTATIADDDPTPALSVAAGAPVSEGAAGAHASFVVRLSAASGRDVSVAYATANASATAGSDYVARSGTLVLPAGSTQAGVDVGVVDDGVAEPTETFELRLASPVAATISAGAAAATILDDDAPGSGAPAPAPASPTAPAAGGKPPQTNPAIPLPVIGSTGPTTGSSSTQTALGVSSPRLKRPSTVLVTLSCPKLAGRCSGRITLFSVPNKRSKIKALRKERKLGRITFTMQGGRAQTVSLALRRSDRKLLQRTGRLRVRAYALTQDAAGRTGVRSVNGTLIARTAHSSVKH
jgi:hypothetical protein